MSDNAPSPTDKDKIADILAIIAAKGDDQKAALIELADQARLLRPRVIETPLKLTRRLVFCPSRRV